MCLHDDDLLLHVLQQRRLGKEGSIPKAVFLLQREEGEVGEARKKEEEEVMQTEGEEREPKPFQAI